MPEYVTQVDPATLTSDLGRLAAIAERFGGQIRSVSPRDADAMFAFYVAARGRFPVGRVRWHVCRHDEGIGDCRPAVVEA